MPAPPWTIAAKRRKGPFPTSGACCCFSAQPSGEKSSLLHTCVQARTHGPARPVPPCSRILPCPRAAAAPCVSSQVTPAARTCPAAVPQPVRAQARILLIPMGPSLGTPCHPPSMHFLSPLPPVSYGFTLISAGKSIHLPCTSPPSLDPSCSSSCFQPATILELKITRNLQPSTLNSAKRSVLAFAVSAKCSVAHPGFSLHLCKSFPLGARHNTGMLA